MRTGTLWCAVVVVMVAATVHGAEDRRGLVHRRSPQATHTAHGGLNGAIGGFRPSTVPKADEAIAQKYTPSYVEPGLTAQEIRNMQMDARAAAQPHQVSEEEERVRINAIKAMSQDVDVVGERPSPRVVPGHNPRSAPVKGMVQLTELKASMPSEPAAGDAASSSEIRTEYQLKSNEHGGFAVNGVERVKVTNMPVLDEKPTDGEATEPMQMPEGAAAASGAASAPPRVPAAPVAPATLQPTEVDTEIPQDQAVDYCFKCVMSYPGRGLIPCGAGHARIAGTKGVLGPDMAHAATEACIDAGRRTSPQFAPYCFADAIGPCQKTEKVRYVFNCYIKNPKVGGSQFERCPIPGPRSNDLLVLEDSPGMADSPKLLAEASRICFDKNQESITGCMAISQDLVQIN